MKRLPIGRSGFENFKSENYVYVDKTALIYNLITKDGGCYFMSRPRRFGKSLLCTTLENIFLGNKVYFEGLAISKTNWDWQKYPVLYINMSSFMFQSIEEFTRKLNDYIDELASHYDFDTSHFFGIDTKFRRLIQFLFDKTNQQVVILIDEYDYPLLSHIGDKELLIEIRESLKTFYTVLKTQERLLRITFITGVSKFSKTSIFSGLNNLDDISMDMRYATLLGYTKEEIKTYFADHLESASKTLNITKEKIIDDLTVWYDGYAFCHDSEKMYNPFSVLKFLATAEFDNYWYETGTPTFLLELIKKYDYPIESFEHIYMAKDELGVFDIESIPLKTLLFQTGYLTITGYDKQLGLHILDFPNQEVKKSFIRSLMQHLTKKEGADVITFAANLKKALLAYDLDLFFKYIRIFFASIPYTVHVRIEKFYQAIFYVMIKMLGAEIEITVEEATNIGRIDAVIQTDKHTYIIECKVDDSPAVAIAQIERTKYYEKFMMSGKEIVLIGLSFDTKERNVVHQVKILHDT